MEQPVQPTPPPSPNPTPYVPPAPLSSQDERLWASLAHFSILINLFTAFLGPLVPLVIYFALRDRSPYVRYQSLQALVFQLIAWVAAGIGAIALWTLGAILSPICVGVLLFPMAILFTLVPIAALVYGIIAGLETYQGKDFKYWLVGDWARGMMTNP